MGAVVANAERQDTRLPLKELTRLVRDLHQPRAAIYWADLIGCIAVAWTGYLLSMPFPDTFMQGSVLAILGFVVSVFALYRASYFNHELSHHANRLPGFAIGWNVLVGIPLLIPSFLYSDHRNHHSMEGFGTDDDVEYFPPHLRGIRGAGALLLTCFVLPVVYIARFSVLLIAAAVSPRVRRWVDVRASSLGILGLSRRAPPTAAERRTWRIQELACGGYLLVSGILLLTGVIPLIMILHFYTILVALLVLHSIRIIVGHRYESEGNPRDRLDQVLDSYNFTRQRLLTTLLAPLGFNLHALHHLFPNIPYHNMPEAHRRISAALPKDSLYHAIEAPSYFAQVWRFLTRSADDRPVSDPRHTGPRQTGGAQIPVP
jgi:fatty acid desaturase